MGLSKWEQEEISRGHLRTHPSDPVHPPEVWKIPKRRSPLECRKCGSKSKTKRVKTEITEDILSGTISGFITHYKCKKCGATWTVSH